MNGLILDYYFTEIEIKNILHKSVVQAVLFSVRNYVTRKISDQSLEV